MPNQNYQKETRGEKLFREALEKTKISFEQEAEIGGYHVDFLIENRIAVEVDGYIHLAGDVQIRDRVKSKRLEDLGYTLMRIADYDVKSPGSLKLFIRTIKEQLNIESKALGEQFKNTPLNTPTLAVLRDKLVKQVQKKAEEPPDDGELFKQAVAKIGQKNRKKR